MKWRSACNSSNQHTLNVNMLSTLLLLLLSRVSQNFTEDAGARVSAGQLRAL